MLGRKLIICALIAATTAACSTGSSYFKNRGEDFLDIARAKVMWGPGAGIKVDVTQWLSLGYIQYGADTWNGGYVSRELFHSWHGSEKSWGLLVGHNEETTVGIPKYSGSWGWTFDDGVGFDYVDPDNVWYDALMLRGRLMIYGGLDLELRVGEILDFLVGIAMLDPSQDDV